SRRTASEPVRVANIVAMTTSNHHPGVPASSRRGALVARGAQADVFEWVRPALEEGVQDPMVVKVRRGASARAETLAEAAALSAVDHPHVVPLIDVVELPEGLGLVLPRLTTESAAAWIQARGHLTAGEAVTLLVPLLRVLVHVERRGLHSAVHLAPSISLDGVLFDALGTPIVTGLRAQPLRGVSRLGGPAAEPADVARGLVGPVMAVTLGGSRHARAEVQRLLEREGLHGDCPEASIDEMIEAVFALDSAAPLEAPLPDVDGAGSGSARGDGGVLAVSTTVGTVASGTSAPQPVSLDTRAAGLARAREMATSWAPVRAVLDSLGEVRPKVWLTTSIVLVSVIIGSSVLARQTAAPRAVAEGDLAPGRSSATAAALPSPSRSATSSRSPTPSRTHSQSGVRDAAVLKGEDADLEG
ncbi:MAG: hypothetical protein JWP75_765, partial [Frondihabitans sp.]|nr:hypothetical protein [Frondihabitans sp.]